MKQNCTSCGEQNNSSLNFCNFCSAPMNTFSKVSANKPGLKKSNPHITQNWKKYIHWIVAAWAIFLLVSFIMAKRKAPQLFHNNTACVLFLRGYDHLSFIDLDSEDTYLSISTKYSRTNMAYSKKRKEIYLISDSTIKVFPSEGSLYEIPIEKSAFDIALSGDENYLYLTFPEQGEIGVVSIEEKGIMCKSKVGEFPTELLLLEEKKLLLITDFKENKVYGMDTKNRVTSFILDTGMGPTAILFIPEKDLLYVSNWTSKDISVFSLSTQSLQYTIDIKGSVSSMALSPDSKKIYAAVQERKYISIIDIESNEITEEILMTEEPVNIKVSPSGKTIYICLKEIDKGSISIRDIKTYSEEKSIKFESTPLNVFFIN